jgi:serine/threonine-protein kinase
LIEQGVDVCPDDGAEPVECTDPRTGQVVDKYRLMGPMGSGGMGTVYRAEHIIIHKPVAIKVLRKELNREDQLVRRFLLEARAASMIRHPNIIDMIDFGATPDGCSYCVMEYLEGPNLAQVMDEVGALPLYRAVNVINQVCRGLHETHKAGIVHRDLKPENLVLLQREGRRHLISLPERPEDDWTLEKERSYDLVKILDFGVAYVEKVTDFLDEETRAQGIVFGSPDYIAPEQVLGETVDHRTDIYSTGVLFYEMLTGDVPFVGETPQEVMDQHLREKPIAPSELRPDLEIPPEADELALKALSKRPENRPQSMDELAGLLRECFGRTFYRRDLKKALHKHRETIRKFPLPDEELRAPSGEQRQIRQPETAEWTPVVDSPEGRLAASRPGAKPGAEPGMEPGVEPGVVPGAEPTPGPAAGVGDPNEKTTIHREIREFFSEGKSEPRRVSQSELNRRVEAEVVGDDREELAELRRLLRGEGGDGE